MFHTVHGQCYINMAFFLKSYNKPCQDTQRQMHFQGKPQIKRCEGFQSTHGDSVEERQCDGDSNLVKSVI